MAMSAEILEKEILAEMKKMGFQVDKEGCEAKKIAKLISKVIPHIQLNGQVAVDPASHQGKVL